MEVIRVASQGDWTLDPEDVSSYRIYACLKLITGHGYQLPGECEVEVEESRGK